MGDNSGYAGLTNFVSAAGDIVMVVCFLAIVNKDICIFYKYEYE